MKRVGFIIVLSAYLYAIDITPIPQKLDFNYDKAILGKELFFDTSLSRDDTISCASCHDLQNGGDDNLKSSFGIGGQEGDINAPTVLNAVFNFAQFWNGRAENLQKQALEPIVNPIEMGNDLKKLVSQLRKTHYVAKFDKIYKDGITKENIANALAEFEKTLITPNSKFDLYLKGDKNALSDYEKEGYELFRKKGCIVCHHGVNMGGNHYSKFGSIIDVNTTSLGRFEVTKQEEDKYFFKVPSLRNIALTAPYLHDGRAKSLRDVVSLMLEVQLGRNIKEEDIEKITAFLLTLTGQVKVLE